MLLFFLFALFQLPELTSPLGKALHANPDTPKLAEARKAYDTDPSNADHLFGLARAHDDSWQFRRSIELYTRGMERFPNDFRFPRYRGHRYISIRQFEKAIADLEGARKLASSSFDVAYHLGLAHYLNGGFKQAAEAYGRCLEMMGQPEKKGNLPASVRSCVEIDQDENSRIAILEWQYRALLRSGEKQKAAGLLAGVRQGMKVTTNGAYYRTLLFYKGLVKQDEILPKPNAPDGNAFPTIGYGIALHHQLEGRKQAACDLYRQIVEERAWSAFGYIAAEAELARGACR
jgi:tetratricopeptide (TPR) repeat protein